MKKLLYILLSVGALFLSSCNGYLNIVPKGEKIPTTLADFEALLRDEYNIGRTPILNALYLLNDNYVTVSNLNSPTLTTANYMWDESADRIMLNSSDEATFYTLYSAISSCNLIVENVPEATESTEEERAEVIAYARIIRSYCYFVLANYYADTYDNETAADTKSVPLITSANINAAYEQVTIQKIYDFIIEDVNTAISNGLPKTSMTAIHPNIGAAYAFLARVYLQMQNYSEALKYAELALAENDNLYDWTEYYETYKAQIENPDNFDNLPSPYTYNYVENYYFRMGASQFNTSELNIPVERAQRFEDGDARFLSRWKYKVENQDVYYKGIASGIFNYGGITTCEVYLIKAECQARTAVNNDYTDAMGTLNKVREKRILADHYAPVSASTLEEAINLIRRTKDNELIFSIVPFADARRFNNEGTYARTLTKVYQDKEYELAPDSHLWTMPFPAGAVNNPGNGEIVQNVAK